VPTATIRNFLVTHDGVPNELVYAMTKSMFEHLDKLAAAHIAGKDIRREEAGLNPLVPLHPGAAAYYKELGLVE
jgi:TRAP transporter TAXI family solute receptor